MKNKKTPKTIHLSEATNTWGCHYQIPGEKKIHYGFSGLPGSASLWLECASGDAVNQIIEAGLGTVINTVQGGYGGEKRTVDVDVDRLESHCRAYWDRVNRAGEKANERRNSCHYCGGTPVDIDFFGEAVCAQCRS